MQSQFKRLKLQSQESTAQVTARALLNRGVLQKDITHIHIEHIYNSLRRISSAPDFKFMSDILPNQSKMATDDTCPLLGVIVETRKHSNLNFVVNNLINTAQIPVQIFHGNKNLDFIMSTSIAKLVDDGKVQLTQLDTNELSANKYNALFLSKRFWRNVIGRNKILVFQTDAVFCTHSDYTINDFISYDYIGSKWSPKRPVGLIIAGGNGGLSLRDWEKTFDCLSRFPSEFWKGGEDGYFAFHIELIGGKVGRGSECAKFSTQEEFLFKSWGGHNISCLNREAQTAFINYCEDATFMLEEANKKN